MSKLKTWAEVSQEHMATEGKEALQWLAEVMRKEGCTVSVHLQFLKRMFPDRRGCESSRSPDL